MADLTNYGEQQIAQHFSNRTQLSLITTFVSLHTSAPGETGSTTDEFSGNGYSRLTIHADGATSPYWELTNGNSSFQNAVEAQFDAASGGNWGAASHFGVNDALTGGNMWLSSDLSSVKTIEDGDTARFAAGELQANVD